MQSGALPIPPTAVAATFSAQDFRAALGLFATGITIITTRTPEGVPVGLTINSFNSVSLDPPLVLWSLGLKAGSLPVFSTVSHYAIHVLHAGQRDLSERFASKGDRFAGLVLHDGLGGVPLLEGCAAVFECRQRSRYVEGDHVILVGEVERCSSSAGAQPLIFHGGRYYAELPL